MPLKQGYSKKAIGANLKAEAKSGKKKTQAIAIALSTARRAAKKKGVSLDKIKGLSPLKKKKKGPEK